MNPVTKALWYIDSHYAQDITLEDVAACAGVSRFHLLRAFGTATGRSIMGYVRGRRLTDAAHRLAAGAEDILGVALEAGYGSHEAFTRAFREQFGVTPESVRREGSALHLDLQEQITMSNIPVPDLKSPRFVQGRTLLLAGLAQHYACDGSSAGIPGQWQKFGPYIDNIPGKAGDAAYGVCYNTDEAGDMDYLCAVEVKQFAGLAPELTTLRVPEKRYAVFAHDDHISMIRGTWNAIWNHWLPESGHEVADAPFFELYPPAFDPQTGNGGVELWVPLKS